MASPTSAIRRVELGATLSEFDLLADRKKFIGPRVFRPRFSSKDSGDFGVVPVEQLLRADGNITRAPRAGYARDDLTFGTAAFKTAEKGVEEVLDDRELALYRDLLDAEQVHSDRGIDRVCRNYELAVAAATYDTSVWTGEALTLTLTSEWDDAEGATPVADIEAGRRKIIDNCGMEPNALIVNRKQFHALKESADIRDRLVYWAGQAQQPKTITPIIMAGLMGLDYVLVAGGIKNTAAEGQDAVFAPIWSDEYAMLARVAETDDPAEACIGRTFVWAEDGPASLGNDEEIAVIVEEYRAEGVRGSVLRIRTDWGLKVMMPTCGVLIDNVTGYTPTP